MLANVGFHKSVRAEGLVKARCAWLLFLPPYSPGLNPLGDGLLQTQDAPAKAVARSFDAIAQALGDICSLFSVSDCRTYFKAAAYEAN